MIDRYYYISGLFLQPLDELPVFYIGSEKIAEDVLVGDDPLTVLDIHPLVLCEQEGRIADKLRLFLSQLSDQPDTLLFSDGQVPDSLQIFPVKTVVSGWDT